MINGKTYYQILGVLEDAEDIVIRAAYKALAQKYHPDKWKGSNEEATQRMSEINQAYSVLSERDKRNTYDKTLNGSEYVDPSGDAGDFTDSIESDWKEVLKYFPDLLTISQSLRKISRSLEQTYRLVLLEKKLFNNRKEVAEELERKYLERFFGSNNEIIKFAKFLISEGHRDAAKELNKAVTLLGSRTESKRIIMTISDKFFRNKSSNNVNHKNETKLQILAKQLIANQGNEYYLTRDLLREVGAIVHIQGVLKFTYTVKFRGDTFVFNDKEYLEYARSIAKKIQKHGFYL